MSHRSLYRPEATFFLWETCRAYFPPMVDSLVIFTNLLCFKKRFKEDSPSVGIVLNTKNNQRMWVLWIFALFMEFCGLWICGRRNVDF